MSRDWNPELYQDRHAFVWQFGRGLMELLAPQPGERILDIGCGTGQLAAEIARSGAEVTGVDASPEMIAQARRNFPDLRFEVADATALRFDNEFDAVFSNAALHWIKNADGVAAGMRRSLKPGGRVVAELGGHGNVRRLIEIAYAALERLGIAHPQDLNPWYFPTIAEYATVLERHGLLVTFAVLFDRPTPLEGGRDALARWFAMFGRCFTDPLAPGQREGFLRDMEEKAAEHMVADGVWTLDYRRLRVVAAHSGR